MKTLGEYFESHTYNIAQAFVVVESAIHLRWMSKKENKYKDLRAHLEDLIEKHKIENMGEICSAHEYIEVNDFTEAEIMLQADKLLIGFNNPAKTGAWDML